MKRGRQDAAPKASYAVTPPAPHSVEPSRPGVVAALTRRTPLLDAAIDQAVTIPASTIRAHVDSLRRRNPEADPQRIIGLLTREYSFLLQGAGGAVGTAAVVPGIGTSVSLVLSTADVATFFTASCAYALAVAEVHGIEVHDTERRRALLLAAVLGDSGAKAIAEVSGKPMAAWGTVLLTSMPTNTIRQVNKVLTGRFVKRMMVKQTSLALGRVIPFGIGAAVGIIGGRVLSRTVVHQTGKAFGPPPPRFLTPVSEKHRRGDAAPSDPALPGTR
ncbi:hypothetical protein SAMN05216410_2424 [Sanguibacter gelidistatuariae]|uniref:EcsC protein family protein n=1 Tax=Sanguibacter gelidistatuariae TaxID=1814289 RepID=A0A1G6Q4Q2_9MICO|nr:hypothetical protein [Sanguibacter gelidistatuariae]SDC86605.1 hypothetical protein SAMN05216410_2424 [Sanguibacter gelidistatuariae]